MPPDGLGSFATAATDIADLPGAPKRLLGRRAEPATNFRQQGTSSLFVEKFPNGAPMEPGVRLQSFGLLNAMLEWSNAMKSGLDISLFGTNLFGANLTNKTYIISNTGVW